MTARLAHIFRHPVKSVGGEALDEVRLTEGQPLPGDRRFAVLHEAAIQHLDGDELRRWLPKSAFVRGVASAPLQAISGGWDGGRLIADVQFLETPHRLTLSCELAVGTFSATWGTVPLRTGTLQDLRKPA